MPELIITTGEVAEMWQHLPTARAWDPDTVHITDVGAPGNEVMRGLWRISLAGLPPNAIVSEAILELLQLPTVRPEPARPLEVQLTDRDWRAGYLDATDSASWNKYRDELDWDTPGGDVAGDAVECTPPADLAEGTVLPIDVTDLVVAALAMQRGELAVRVKHKVEDGSDDVVAFAHYASLDHTPTLTVTYTVPAASSGRLLVTLPADDGYDDGDVIEVLVDGLSVARFDLRPGGEDFPETEVITDVLAFGWHAVTVRVLDAVGNVSDGDEYAVWVNVGPRRPASLRFASQVDDGPITFSLGKSLDDVSGGSLVAGYRLYRGPVGAIDFNTVVGAAAAGATTITEDDNMRHTTDGIVAYAVRAYNAGTYEDDADPAVGTQVTVVAGEVQLPSPLQVKVWTLEAAAEGRIRVSASVNNIGAETPVAALRVYSGDTAPSYAAPIGTIAVATSGASTVVGTFDPGLAHGTTCAVVIRAMSSDDVEEANTDAKTAVIDSEAPAELEGVTVEEVAA